VNNNVLNHYTNTNSKDCNERNKLKTNKHIQSHQKYENQNGTSNIQLLMKHYRKTTKELEKHNNYYENSKASAKLRKTNYQLTE
jgi:hypothetical protein